MLGNEILTAHPVSLSRCSGKVVTTARPRRKVNGARGLWRFFARKKSNLCLRFDRAGHFGTEADASQLPKLMHPAPIRGMTIKYNQLFGC
jgi:hypothetical protein